MPVYNTGKHLKTCLNSILNQTETNWELVAVNDFSSDDSLAVLQEFSDKDPRIKVLNNTKKGIIPALKTAYAVTCGEFITRMDSDDIMVPQKLEILKNNLQNNGSGHLATGAVSYFSEAGVGAGFQRYEEWLNGLTKDGSNFSEIYKECVIPSPNWMCFRSDFDLAEGFNADRYPEDYDLTFRFYQSGLKVVPCSLTTHQWRDYPTRTSRTDPNYADQTFIDIKLAYFLKLHHDPSKQLLIWGAGKKGKKIAEKLTLKGIKFTWICDNPNKIGKEIYGTKLIDFNALKNFHDFQSIITVANPTAKLGIENSFTQQQLQSMKDYFYFC